MYNFTRPILFIRDPQLIKELAIKHFDSFNHRIPHIDPDSDPLWGANLTQIRGMYNVTSIISSAHCFFICHIYNIYFLSIYGIAAYLFITLILFVIFFHIPKPNILLFLQGERWKEMRQSLSGSFTSSKMKFIFELLNKSCSQFAEHYASANGPTEVDMNQVSARYVFTTKYYFRKSLVTFYYFEG